MDLGLYCFRCKILRPINTYIFIFTYLKCLLNDFMRNVYTQILWDLGNGTCTKSTHVLHQIYLNYFMYFLLSRHAHCNLTFVILLIVLNELKRKIY